MRHSSGSGVVILPDEYDSFFSDAAKEGLSEREPYPRSSYLAAATTKAMSAVGERTHGIRPHPTVRPYWFHRARTGCPATTGRSRDGGR